MVLTFRHSQPPRLSVQPQPDEADVDRLARQAAAHAGRGENAKALKCYEYALLMDEARADLWFHYGVVQRRSKLLEEALESFEFALRLEPALYTARYQMARVCYELGRPLEALSHFQAVTREKPDYVPAWRHAVQLTWALGNHDDAESLAREALQRSPADAELEMLLARVVEDRQGMPTET